jgi:hypothetical protein
MSRRCCKGSRHSNVLNSIAMSILDHTSRRWGQNRWAVVEDKIRSSAEPKGTKFLELAMYPDYRTQMYRYAVLHGGYKMSQFMIII